MQAPPVAAAMFLSCGARRTRICGLQSSTAVSTGLSQLRRFWSLMCFTICCAVCGGIELVEPRSVRSRWPDQILPVPDRASRTRGGRDRPRTVCRSCATSRLRTYSVSTSRSFVRAGVVAERFENRFQIADGHALAQQVLHDLLQLAGLDLRWDHFFDEGGQARLEVIEQILHFLAREQVRGRGP